MFVYMNKNKGVCFVSFYERFASLCQGKGVKPGRAAMDCGINRSNVTAWKKGGYTPRAEVLQRIAAYFGVSVDELMGDEPEKAPAPVGERGVSDEEMMFALWGDTRDVDRADLEDVKRYAAFVRERKRRT